MEIPAGEIVKAYQWAPDEYVVIDDDDLAELPIPTSKSIVIQDFVHLDAVDPIFFDKAYFLEPIDGGSKAYSLLREAMRATSQVALAKVAIRTKETLACVRIYQQDILALQTMHYPDEIRSASALPGLQPAAEFAPRELELAVQLIEQLSSPFQPEKYRDQYREALLARIEAKVRGEEIVVPQQPEPRVVDLMEALRASLAAVSSDSAPGAGNVGMTS